MNKPQKLFYVPDNTGISLEPDVLCGDDKSHWNEVHTRRSQIRYTKNFHLVLSAELVE